MPERNREGYQPRLTIVPSEAAKFLIGYELAEVTASA
jgi:hypothetical protein